MDSSSAGIQANIQPNIFAPSTYSRHPIDVCPGCPLNQAAPDFASPSAPALGERCLTPTLNSYFGPEFQGNHFCSFDFNSQPALILFVCLIFLPISSPNPPLNPSTWCSLNHPSSIQYHQSQIIRSTIMGAEYLPLDILPSIETSPTPEVQIVGTPDSLPPVENHTGFVLPPRAENTEGPMYGR